MVKKKPPDLLDLVAKQEAVNRLRSDLTEADRECSLANEAQQPFATTFWSAHAYLMALPSRPASTKEERLAAYDARLRAGHAWQPHRARYRDALRWFDAILRELKTYE